MAAWAIAMIFNYKNSRFDQYFPIGLLIVAVLCGLAGFIYWQVSRPETPSSVSAYQRLVMPSTGILESVAASVGVDFEPGSFSALPVGHPQSRASGVSLPSVDEMAQRLRRRLDSQEIGDVQGWFLLGRTYMELKQYGDAVAAFERAEELAPNNSGVLVSLADSLSMQAGGAYSEQARRLIERARQIDPDNQNARWMAGNIAVQRGDTTSALLIWRELLPELEDQRRDQLALQIATVDSRVSLSADAMKVSQDM